MTNATKLDKEQLATMICLIPSPVSTVLPLVSSGQPPAGVAKCDTLLSLLECCFCQRRFAL